MNAHCAGRRSLCALEGQLGILERSNADAGGGRGMDAGDVRLAEGAAGEKVQASFVSAKRLAAEAKEASAAQQADVGEGVDQPVAIGMFWHRFDLHPLCGSMPAVRGRTYYGAEAAGGSRHRESNGHAAAREDRHHHRSSDGKDHDERRHRRGEDERGDRHDADGRSGHRSDRRDHDERRDADGQRHRDRRRDDDYDRDGRDTKRRRHDAPDK